MNDSRDPIEPLPQVESSPAQFWHYWRVRYVPVVVSGMMVVVAIGLWGINLPELPGDGRSTSRFHPVNREKMVAHQLPVGRTQVDESLASGQIVPSNHSDAISEQLAGKD